MPKVLKICGAVSGVLIVFYGLFLGGLYVCQDKLVYHPAPRQVESLRKEMPDLKEVDYFLPSGEQVYAWYKAPEKDKPVLVYFHGNVQYAEYHALRLKPLYEAGFGLLIPEYRGYGDLKGKPSQQSMEQDAVTAVKYLISTGTKANKIVLYGHSLGTYAALFAAARQEKPLGGVVLEAPFLSLETLAKEKYEPFVPVSLLLKNKYPSENYIDKINTRLFLAHGKIDKTIPYRHGWELYEKARQPKLFYSADKAGHSNLPAFGFMEALIEWLEE